MIGTGQHQKQSEVRKHFHHTEVMFYLENAGTRIFYAIIFICLVPLSILDIKILTGVF